MSRWELLSRGSYPAVPPPNAYSGESDGQDGLQLARLCLHLATPTPAEAQLLLSVWGEKVRTWRIAKPSAARLAELQFRRPAPLSQPGALTCTHGVWQDLFATTAVLYDPPLNAAKAHVPKHSDPALCHRMQQLKPSRPLRRTKQPPKRNGLPRVAQDTEPPEQIDAAGSDAEGEAAAAEPRPATGPTGPDDAPAAVLAGMAGEAVAGAGPVAATAASGGGAQPARHRSKKRARVAPPHGGNGVGHGSSSPGRPHDNATRAHDAHPAAAAIVVSTTAGAQLSAGAGATAATGQRLAARQVVAACTWKWQDTTPGYQQGAGPPLYAGYLTSAAFVSLFGRANRWLAYSSLPCDVKVTLDGQLRPELGSKAAHLSPVWRHVLTVPGGYKAGLTHLVTERSVSLVGIQITHTVTLPAAPGQPYIGPRIPLTLQLSSRVPAAAVAPAAGEAVAAVAVGAQDPDQAPDHRPRRRAGSRRVATAGENGTGAGQGPGELQCPDHDPPDQDLPDQDLPDQDPPDQGDAGDDQLLEEGATCVGAGDGLGTTPSRVLVACGELQAHFYPATETFVPLTGTVRARPQLDVVFCMWILWFLIGTV